jgi:hypothetical protein
MKKPTVIPCRYPGFGHCRDDSGISHSWQTLVIPDAVCYMDFVV